MGFMLEKVIQTFDTVTGWAVLGDDTVNLAVTNNRVRGLKALEFDKFNGGDNTKLAGAEKTIVSKLDQFPPHYAITWYCFVSALTLVDYTFVRIGTDDANYVEYRFPDTSMTAGVFSFANVKLATFSAMAGTGADFSAITYVAAGVAFDAEGDALADIAIDRLAILPTVLTVS